MTHRAALSPPPVLGNFGSPQPRPVPGDFTRPLTAEELRARAYRVVTAGGALPDVLTDDRSTQPFEQLFRRLPEDGIHDPTISPVRPFKFECGAFRVPSQQALLLFDLRPDIYRFSGVDPNDAVPVEARRFGSQVGFEITVDGNHPGNTRFELEPIRRQTGLEFQPNQGTDTVDNPGTLPPASAFVQARANRFGAASGAGLSLLPQRPFRYGPSSLPLTLVITENQSFAIHVVVFKPIQTPIAFFEFDMAGILLPLQLAGALLDCISLKGAGGG